MFHMNNFDTIIENKAAFLLSKIRLLVLKMLNWSENKNHWTLKFVNFCSAFIALIEIKQEK